MTFYLATIFAFYLAIYPTWDLAFYLENIPAFYLALKLMVYLQFFLALEVRPCPLRPGHRRLKSDLSGRSWLRSGGARCDADMACMRSGSAHCDRELAVEVRR